MRRHATSSRGPRSSSGGVYSGRSSRNGRLPSVDSRQRTQAYSGNDEFLQDMGHGRPISSSSGETDSGLISSFDADPNGRPGLPISPMMSRTPSNRISSHSSIQQMSEGSRAHGSPRSQPRVVDFHGRSSNEARSSMTASPSGGRRDDSRDRAGYERGHDGQALR